MDKDGEELELRLFVRSEEKDSVTEGQFIEDWFKEAGIGLETKAISDTALTDAIYAADYDMFIWGWGSDADPDFILSVLTCDQIMGWSDTFWCNEDYSRMYQEQKEQLDLDERAATIKEMQRIAYEDEPLRHLLLRQPARGLADGHASRAGPRPRRTPTRARWPYTFSNATYMNLRPLSSRAARAVRGAAAALPRCCTSGLASSRSPPSPGSSLSSGGGARRTGPEPGALRRRASCSRPSARSCSCSS